MKGMSSKLAEMKRLAGLTPAHPEYCLSEAAPGVSITLEAHNAKEAIHDAWTKLSEIYDDLEEQVDEIDDDNEKRRFVEFMNVLNDAYSTTRKAEAKLEMFLSVLKKRG